MSSTIACPGCQLALKKPAELPSGKCIRCPHCGTTLGLDGTARSLGVTTASSAARPIALASPRPSSSSKLEKPSKRFSTGALLASLFLVLVLFLGGAAVAVLWYFGSRSTRADTSQAAAPIPAQQPMPRPATGKAERPVVFDPRPGGPVAVGPAGVPGRPRQPIVQPPGIPKPPIIPQQPRRPQIGEAAPEIEGKDLDGKPMKLSDFRGKVVVLDFWGDWCPYCKSAYTYQRYLVRRMAGRSFVLVGVNCDNTAEQARLVVKNQRLSWRSWWDGSQAMNGPIYKRWGVQAVPSVYVLDTKGVIRSHFQGAPPQGALDAVVEGLLPASERGPSRWLPPGNLLPQLVAETEAGDYRLRLPKDFTASQQKPEEGRQTFLWKHTTFFSGGTRIEVSLRPAAEEKPEDAIEKVLAELPCQRQGWTCQPAQRGEVNGLTFHRVNWSGLYRGGKHALRGFVYAGVDGDRLILIAGQTSESDRTPGSLAEAAALTFRKK